MAHVFAMMVGVALLAKYLYAQMNVHLMVNVLLEDVFAKKAGEVMIAR